ncbi:MAG: hypothetical protein LC792_18645 [Actinobacteria bacterium]|nr:hypothetical protein [Actinomycetota bacterium]
MSDGLSCGVEIHVAQIDPTLQNYSLAQVLSGGLDTPIRELSAYPALGLGG